MPSMQFNGQGVSIEFLPGDLDPEEKSCAGYLQPGEGMTNVGFRYLRNSTVHEFHIFRASGEFRYGFSAHVKIMLSQAELFPRRFPENERFVLHRHAIPRAIFSAAH